MKKNDLFLIIIIIAAAALLSLWFYASRNDSETKLVRISAQGEVIATYPLDEDHTEDFKLPLGSNTIVIKDQKAFVSHADCDNQICVNTPPISEVGESIACLPHQLILEIVAGD